jgi:two-component sensor histidine kinase/ligand-binding sensor domain-containing protein
VEDGLSQSEPKCLVQDVRGYLWIGTAGGGVCSFDGIKFHEYGKREGLPGEIISCEAEDSSGNMWFGTSSAGATMYDGKTFTRIDEKRGLSSNDIKCIVAKKDVILIGVPDGIFEFNPTTNLLRQIVAVKNLLAMCVDEDGILWAASADGLFRISRGLKFEIDLKIPTDKDHSINALKSDGHGLIYLGMNDGLMIYRPSTGTFTQNELTSILEGKLIHNFFIDHTQALWVGTWNNLVVKYSIDGKIISYDKSNGLTAETIYAITEDDTRHIWIGTREQSLVKLRSEAFTYFGNLPGLGTSTVFKILEDHSGKMWIGSNEEGLHVYDGKESKPVLNGGKIFKQPVAIVEDKEQKIWVGHFDGVTCLVNEHPVKTILAGIRVRSLLTDSEGNLWIGTWGKGLFKYDGNKIENFTQENKKLPGNFVHAIYEDHKGNLWIGTGAGLVKYTATDTVFYGEKDGLCNWYVGQITEDNYGNIWFHTDVCIMRYDGNKFRSYTDENGLASNTFYLLTFDTIGQLWVGTNKGIDRVKIDANGNFLFVKNYARNEGFRGIECNSRSVCLTRDGCLWFGTVKGVVRYNPIKDEEDNVVPSAHITGIRLFLEQTDWAWTGAQEAGWFHLPQELNLDFEHNHLTFLYEAIHLQSPQSIRYKFMLVGFDSVFQPITSSTEITYTNLPPGKYIFKVVASNNETNWNSTPAVSCNITILPPPPPFYTRVWFILLCIFSVGGILTYIIVARTRRILYQKEILEKEVRERTLEISKQNEEKTVMLKEIHHRVKNNLQVISSLLNLQADGISDKHVLSLFEDCKHRVNSMALIHEKMYQSKNLVNIDIRNYIDELVRSLIDAYDSNKLIHLKTDIEDHPFLIDTIVPLGLILNEIISNSLKYAFEDKLEGELFVSLHNIAPHRFVLEVSDNGKGIPEPINFEKAESLGMQLILMLSGQINGKVEVKVEGGTRYKIEFEEEVKERF